MLFIVRFTDKPGEQDRRKQYLQAHLSWLAERRDTILVAGSLREEPDANPVGGAWIVEAASKQEVAALFESDPFWRHGLRADVEILYWSKAFPDEQVLV